MKPEINRRGAIKLGVRTMLAALAAHSSRSAWAFPRRKRAGEKACIVLWMNGGPSHIDTFDPKTGRAGGRFKAIATRVAGIEVTEHLPRLAEYAHRLAIVRGMT